MCAGQPRAWTIRQTLQQYLKVSCRQIMWRLLMRMPQVMQSCLPTFKTRMGATSKTLSLQPR